MAVLWLAETERAADADVRSKDDVRVAVGGGGGWPSATAAAIANAMRSAVAFLATLIFAAPAALALAEALVA